MRSTADIVADLRATDHYLHWTWEATVLEAADHLAELDVAVARLERTDAFRLPCPTCGGVPNAKRDFRREGIDQEGRRVVTFNCPDCTDGRMSHEQAWKIVAAVFADDAHRVVGPHSLDYRDYLRGIR